MASQPTSPVALSPSSKEAPAINVCPILSSLGRLVLSAPQLHAFLAHSRDTLFVLHHVLPPPLAVVAPADKGVKKEEKKEAAVEMGTEASSANDPAASSFYDSPANCVTLFLPFALAMEARALRLVPASSYPRKRGERRWQEGSADAAYVVEVSPSLLASKGATVRTFVLCDDEDARQEGRPTLLMGQQGEKEEKQKEEQGVEEFRVELFSNRGTVAPLRWADVHGTTIAALPNSRLALALEEHAKQCHAVWSDEKPPASADPTASGENTPSAAPKTKKDAEKQVGRSQSPQ